MLGFASIIVRKLSMKVGNMIGFEPSNGSILNSGSFTPIETEDDIEEDSVAEAGRGGEEDASAPGDFNASTSCARSRVYLS
jgi:hypothetical protein